MTERVVLCEGYHDRAFWQGALKHLGCLDPGEVPSGRRKPVLDDGGKEVRGGDFGFGTNSGSFVRVRPCVGRSNVLQALRGVLKGLGTAPRERIVVNWDDDGDARTGSVPRGMAATLRDAVQHVDSSATANATGDLVLSGYPTLVSATAWWTPDPHSPSLPWKQTLERLVCASLDAAYPGRGARVGQWLAGAAPTTEHKAHAWSHMAGWHADEGCDTFYKLLWQDALVVTELKSRLTECGAWRLMQALAK